MACSTFVYEHLKEVLKMKSLMSWLLAFIAVIFWGFRVVTCLMYSMGIDFIDTPYNFTTEVGLLFLTIVSIILIFKRSVPGGIIYLLTYWIYFGMSAYDPFVQLLDGTSDITVITKVVISAIGLILPTIIFIDILLDKTRTSSRSNKLTDWFYKNKDYDRKLDERADKNNYKIQ